MKQLQILIIAIFSLMSTACKAAEPEKTPEAPANVPTPVFSNLSINTNKSAYKPGDVVSFSMHIPALATDTKVRYKHLNTVIDEETITTGNWTWKTPANDYTGYVAEVYSLTNNVETIYATIGIDVSSDWKKFPRYGFLSKFGSVSDNDMNAIISNLNRYHINGIQFYDWQNKHHIPLPLNGTTPLASWKDIGNRDIYFSTVEKYIAAAHTYNMKAMFYDLVYGAWNNADADGVKKEWYIYTDNTHSNIDLFALNSPFISNLYFLDPGNTEWQNYMKESVKSVYKYLSFDGYHMDQVGDRGTRYKYDGSFENLATSFKPYIDAIKTAAPEKYNVMNAVAQYGQPGIATSTSDFLYSEVWSPSDSYNDLVNIIKQNNTLSNNTKNTVLAAYMNYDRANNVGYFNTPSILMANAVIFAFGGDHLELGEHMLCKEYFPNNNLTMKDDLKQALVNYYDFLVAYQNLLRDGGTFNTVGITSTDSKMSVSAWPAAQGKVAVVGKKYDTTQVIHFINFSNSTTQQWRDKDGIQVMPALIKDARLLLTTDKTVRKMWIATPDVAGGASRSLNFAQSGNKVSFILPELRYWDMVVVEY
ncbi:MAG: glycoside hydrolase family 66 protein [Paludibacter sp.]|nr:glycoside hydrolase family 66 protein [Paludibacter sp.]